MGFIDSMMPPPESDLYRFADPAEKVHRLAVQDMEATAARGQGAEGPFPSNPQPLPQSPIPNLQSGIPTLPPANRVLSFRDWAGKNYPQMASHRRIRKDTWQNMVDGYKLYLAVQEMGMRERMSQFHAKMRAAELGERRAGRVQGAKGRRGQGAKGARGEGGEVMPREDMFPKGYYAETIAGPSKQDPLLEPGDMLAQGLLGRMREGPKQWLGSYLQIQGMLPFNSDRTNRGLADALSRSKPTLQEVEAADLTPEETAAILEIILTPEQLEAYKERARFLENQPKPSFWDRLLPGPSARPTPGKVTPY